jgi:YidC/Oxa1 family membrane protein insertase
MGMLLNFLYKIIGNYGVSIIVFTILIKLVLLPLTFKQLQSTKQMSAIQPKLKELQEKYKNDKEKLNMKIMELYKEYKINPMAGCLPLLIQLPIIFGLFSVLREPTKYITDPTFVKAVNEGFLWIPNLSEPDKLILPLIAGVTTYLSMKATTVSGPQNQTMKIMNTAMPIMIVWWGRSFPAGLTLYWAVSNTFQMVQQYFMPKPNKSKEELS